MPSVSGIKLASLFLLFIIGHFLFPEVPAAGPMTNDK